MVISKKKTFEKKIKMCYKTYKNVYATDMRIKSRGGEKLLVIRAPI